MDRVEAALQSILLLKRQIEDAKSRLSTGSLSDARGRLEARRHRVSMDVQRRLPGGGASKVTALCWSASGSDIVVASQDGKLTVWDAMGERRRFSALLRSAWLMTVCLDFSEQPQYVATGGLDNLCCIYDLSKAPQRVSAFRELSAHDGYMSCCRFVDDERQVLTSSGDSTCILWDVGRSVPKVHFNDHTGDVLTVSVSPTSPNVFVSGSSDATAKVWDMRLGKAVGTYAVHLSDVSCTAFMASGTVFATSSDDATCRLFDIRCPGQLASLQSEARVCGVPAVDFAKSGRLLFAGYEDSSILVWDMLAGKKLSTPVLSLPAHSDRVTCLQVNGSGHALASGSWDSDVCIHA